MMREIDVTHLGRISKSGFVAILMDSYGEDALQQYDDRLYHDPEYSFTLSQEAINDKDRWGEVTDGSITIDGGYFF